MNRFGRILLTVAISLSLSAGAAAGEPVKMGYFNHLGLGVGIGTTGIEIEAGVPCTRWLQMRSGISFTPIRNIRDLNINLCAISDEQWEEVQKIARDPDVLECIDLTGVKKPDQLNMDAGLYMTNFKFLVDFFPFRKSSFHVTAGFYVGPSKLLDVDATVGDGTALRAIYQYNYTLDNLSCYPQYAIELSDLPNIGVAMGYSYVGPNSRGVVNAYVKVKSFKPYLGIGFGRVVPSKTRLSFACDVGVQFWSTPTICSVDVDGMEHDALRSINVEETKNVVEILSKITVYPVINFRLTGRIF